MRKKASHICPHSLVQGSGLVSPHLHWENESRCTSLSKSQIMEDHGWLVERQGWPYCCKESSLLFPSGPWAWLKVQHLNILGVSFPTHLGAHWRDCIQKQWGIRIPKPRVCVITIACLCRRTFSSVSCDPLKVNKVKLWFNCAYFLVTYKLPLAQTQTVGASLTLSIFHESTTFDRAGEQRSLRECNPTSRTSALLQALKQSPHRHCPPLSAPSRPGQPRARRAGSCWEAGNHRRHCLWGPGREISCTKLSAVCKFTLLPSMLNTLFLPNEEIVPDL